MLIARDGGCRFPGCQAPVQWCVGHHIRPGQGGDDPKDLILACEGCHDIIHTQKWKITLGAGGKATFTRGRRQYTTHPRAPG
jgi:hypothetical protein